jgi:hypothetical protein
MTTQAGRTGESGMSGMTDTADSIAELVTVYNVLLETGDIVLGEDDSTLALEFGNG